MASAKTRKLEAERSCSDGSMIFDTFPDLDHAMAFAKAVHSRCRRNVCVITSRVDAEMVRPFPWQLEPPIVYVARRCSLIPGEKEKWSIRPGEEEIKKLAAELNGTFPGT